MTEFVDPFAKESGAAKERPLPEASPDAVTEGSRVSAPDAGEGEVTASGGVGSQPTEAEGATPSSAISPSKLAEGASATTVKAPSVTSAAAAKRMKELVDARPEIIKTTAEASAVLAERGAEVPASTPGPRSSRSALPRRKKVAPERGDGKCTAYAPRGTKCKLCGKVHPL